MTTIADPKIEAQLKEAVQAERGSVWVRRLGPYTRC
jgi:hypothetical protein